MAKKKDIDFDEELARIARQTNIKVKKTEFAYESQLKQLDDDIDKILKDKLDSFDKFKELTSSHLQVACAGTNHPCK